MVDSEWIKEVIEDHLDSKVKIDSINLVNLSAYNSLYYFQHLNYNEETHKITK